MPTGTLEVIVVEGRELKDKDIVGQNDAFVEICLDKRYKQRTTTISNTNNSTQSERFTFNLQRDDDVIHFNIYVADVVGHDFIGKCKMKLKHVFDDGKFDEWVKLPAMHGLSSKGQIHGIMKFTVSTSNMVVLMKSSFDFTFSHHNYDHNTIRKDFIDNCFLFSFLLQLSKT
jgi:Ca2+-dependent lipid-binding protein